MVSTGGTLEGNHASAGIIRATPACNATEASELPAIVRDPSRAVMLDSSKVSSPFERATAPARDPIAGAMAKTKIVLYQTDWCSYCVRVREALAQLGLEYRIVNVPDEHAKRTELAEIFGTTGVPSITDGTVKIADDDDAIVDYLVDTYG
jgi:glutaredoxin 3